MKNLALLYISGVKEAFPLYTNVEQGARQYIVLAELKDSNISKRLEEVEARLYKLESLKAKAAILAL